MSGLTPEDEALLRQARDGGLPTAADQERVKRKVLLQLGISAAVGTSAASASGGAAGAAGFAAGGGIIAGATKVVLAVSLAVGAVGTGVVVLRGYGGADGRSLVSTAALPSSAVASEARGDNVPWRDAPPPGPAETTGVQAGAPSPEMRTIRETETSPIPGRRLAVIEANGAASPTLPLVEAGPEPIPQSPPPPSGPATVGAEAQVLREADAALRRGDAARALALLNDHAARFPDGILGEERDAERVVVLCALGHIEDARAAAASFLRRSPRSPLAGRVRASCNGAP